MASLPKTRKAYLTPNEVAELLMVSPVTVRTWAQKGLLVAKVTPGGHRRFLRSDVERFVRECGVTQDSAEPSVIRVLIVDDDPSTRDQALGSLASSGPIFLTETAQNDFEAGVKVQSFSPNVVLLNFTSETIDAFRICSLISRDFAARRICVIAITDGLRPENLTRILEAGAVTFLVKPFSPQDVLGILNHAVGIKKTVPAAQDRLLAEPEPRGNGLDNAEGFLFSLAHMIKAKNCVRGAHDPARLTRLVDIFGRTLGRSSDEMQALRNACVFHDVGNLGIPESILLKPEPLSEEEWTVIRSHTIIGAQLCSGLPEMGLTIPIIRSHHERWDGSGYPDGLKGESIPYLARVFQFIDIFDALSSERSYRPALSFEEVMSIIRKEIANDWLDPVMGASFLKLQDSELSTLVGHPI